MKYAVQDSLLGLENYYQNFLLAKELNFDGVEISIVGKSLNKEITNEIIDASTKTGITPSAICGGYRNWIGDFDNDKRMIAVNDIINSLQNAKRMNAEGLIAPAAYGMFSKRLPPFNPPRSTVDDRKKLLDSLNRIAEYAEKYDMFFYFEPLNRYEDHMVNTIKQAADITKEVASKHVKILADFFHMSIEEADINKTIIENSNDIGYYHLADSNRLQPGKGHTNFDSYIKSIQKTGYKGFLSFECGIDSLEKEDALKKSLNYLKDLEED